MLKEDQVPGFGSTHISNYARVYPKVSELAARRENCKW